MAVGTIKDTANLYNTTTFFTNRTVIKDALHKAVNTTFYTQSNGAILVPEFQLRRVSADAVVRFHLNSSNPQWKLRLSQNRRPRNSKKFRF